MFKNLNKKDIIKITICSFIFIIPLIFFQCTNDDFLTHISRMYNLAVSFKQGNFNPYMYQSCFLKYGYPFGIFYPDTFMKPFSFLIYIGVPIYISSIIMLFFINFFTFFVPYFLLKKVEKLKNNAYLISLIYFIYPYRFFDFANRFSIGELMFFIFFPMILYGLYLIFYENKLNWYLAFGFYGIVHSHILSILLILFFCVFFYIINIKKIIKNLNIIKYTILNAIVVLFTNIDVYLPILEAQKTEKLLYQYNNTFSGTLNENTFQIIKQNNIINIIVVIIFILLIYLIYKNTSMITKSILSIVLLVLVLTNLFNWDYITNIFPFLNIIQFPFRLLVFGCIPFTYLIFKLHNWFVNFSNFRITTLFLGLELFIFFAFCYVYPHFNFNDMYQNVGAGDYTNIDVDRNGLSFMQHNKNFDKNIASKEYLCEDGYLPIFYYKNYQITNGSTSYNYENKDGIIYVPKLKNTNTKVIVSYKNTFIQNFSYIISWISCIIFLIYLITKNRKS